MKRNRYLTRTQHKLLQALADHVDGKLGDDEDGDLTQVNGRGFMSGPRWVTRSGRALLRFMLVKPDSDPTGRKEEVVYYTITSAGRTALADPDFEPPGKQLLEGRVKCDCSPQKRRPTRYDTCGYCSRQLR